MSLCFESDSSFFTSGEDSQFWGRSPKCRSETKFAWKMFSALRKSLLSQRTKVIFFSNYKEEILFQLRHSCSKYVLLSRICWFIYFGNVSQEKPLLSTANWIFTWSWVWLKELHYISNIQLRLVNTLYFQRYIMVYCSQVSQGKVECKNSWKNCTQEFKHTFPDPSNLTWSLEQFSSLLNWLSPYKDTTDIHSGVKKSLTFLSDRNINIKKELFMPRV